MRPRVHLLLLASIALSASLAAAQALDELPLVEDAHYPDLSPDGSRLAFTWQGDIWVAPLEDGKGVARRITVHAAYDERPRFSPDGTRIAFTSNRYGGGDIFIVPAEGGTIRRVTYHSASDVIADWSPDGQRILFNASGRDHRDNCPYEIDLASGCVRPVLKDVCSISATSYSPDGRYVAGIRRGEAWWRKGYRGSGNSNVFIYDTREDTMRIVTDFPGMDLWPMFSSDGSEIYWVSEREGRPNLFAMNIGTTDVRPLTSFIEDAVTFPAISGDGKQIVYEWNFGLWTVPTGGGPPSKLEIRAPVDYRENFEADETATGSVEEMEVNRDCSWIAIRLRDDIFLVRPDFKNGSVRITDWPGMDGDYFWHPNGKQLAYISQQNGTSDIWVYDLDTKEKRCLVRDDENYLDILGYTWDGEQLLFRHGFGGDGVYSADPTTGRSRQLLSEPDVEELQISPDGRWIAASIDHARSGRDIYIRPVDGGEWTNISEHPSGSWSPMWSPDGKKLFWVTRRWGTPQICSVDLKRPPVEFDDYEAQFAKEEQEKAAKEKPKETPPPSSDEQPADAEGEQPKPAEEEWPAWKRRPIEPIEIDLQRISKRIKRVTTSNVDEGLVGFSADGKSVIYRRGGQIWSMKLDGSDQSQFVKGDYSFGSVRLTEDGAWIVFTHAGRLYRVDAKRGGDATEVTFKAELDRDARTLQKWAFQQGWALLDEQFYSYNRHGVDWKAVYEHYARYCTGTLLREDFQNLMNRMIGELNASHLGCYGGGRGGKDTGRLGVVADPNHVGPGVRVLDVMPDGPCDQPEATVAVGEYIVAVNGEPVSNSEQLYDLLTDTVGKRVKLLVGAEPSTDGAREISVKPISGGAWFGLDYERQQERNRRMASDLSGGRVYYIHMTGMNSGQLQRLRDELFGPAQHYDAVIIDVRNNGGGYTHDAVIEELVKRVHGWTGVRGQPLRTSPWQQFDGPVCCLINENSYSDAEIFPNAFRERGLGKVIGMPTFGAVIGTWDTQLVNGVTFRIPVAGWYRMDGANLENYGVPPDIMVPYTYEDYRDGRDPQIEAAVRQLLSELEQRPRVVPPHQEGRPSPPFGP